MTAPEHEPHRYQIGDRVMHHRGPGEVVGVGSGRVRVRWANVTLWELPETLTGATVEPATLRDRIADALTVALLAQWEPDGPATDVDHLEMTTLADVLLPVFAAELRRLINEAHATRRHRQITGSRIAELVIERMRELETGTTP